MTLRKGENVPLPTALVELEFSRRAGAGVPRADACALLVADGSARGPDDLVHAAAPVHPSGAVRHLGSGPAGDTAVDTLTVDLGSVEAAVTSVLVVARADGGPFGRIPGLRLRVASGGAEAARFDCEGATTETAYVLGECYRRGGGWKFRAVGQGYDSGLVGLGAEYGLRPADVAAVAAVAAGARPVAEPPARPVVVERPAPARPAGAPPSPPPGPVPVNLPPPAPFTAPAPGPAPVRLTKVTLTKEAPAVSLTKQGGTSGALRVNLSWRANAGRTGGRFSKGGGVDLDLCALFELSDGSKGVVQALGNAFGSLHQPPFLHLDGDDRTGGAASGENLTVNLDHRAHFRRILIFVTIYEGARSFAGLHATVTLQPEHGAPVDFVLDECTVQSNVCALALVVREGDDLVVRREARYLVPRRGVSPQRTVDYAYGWGLQWSPGRK